jgi:hypothetical protein
MAHGETPAGAEPAPLENHKMRKSQDALADQFLLQAAAVRIIL